MAVRYLFGFRHPILDQELKNRLIGKMQSAYEQDKLSFAGNFEVLLPYGRKRRKLFTSLAKLLSALYPDTIGP